jgi:hypothetical protein
MKKNLVRCLLLAGAVTASAQAWATPGPNAVQLTCWEALKMKSPGSSQPVTVTIPNDSETTYELIWIDFQGKPKSYGFIKPHEVHTQKTFVGHVWLLTDEHGQCTTAFAATEPTAPTTHSNSPVTWKTDQDDGITYVFASTVSDVALKRAKFVVDHMLENLPDVRASMKKSKFKVEIIAKDQVLSDLPDYASFKGGRTRDGRDYDTGTRGLGGEDMCSIGEENLLCLAQQPYRDEDILVHEFSHSIKFHLGRELSSAIDAAFQNASDKSLYPSGIYMIRDAQEYWAEGTQVWFAATRRSDVNGGFNTRDTLRDHDPKLAEMLERVWGKTQVEKVQGCKY